MLARDATEGQSMPMVWIQTGTWTPNASPSMTPREAIAATPWLGSVPEATVDQLADQSALHRMPPGSTLFEQAETPAFALLLVGGSVELLAVRGAEETLVEFVRAPDLLLPAAVLNRQPYLMRAGFWMRPAS